MLLVIVAAIAAICALALLLVIGRGVLSRRRHQAELQETSDRLLVDVRSRSARFRSLIEHSADGITVVNAEGRIVYASAPAERMLGYRPGEMVGDSILELVHPDERERYNSERQSELQGARPEPGRFRMRHKNGSWRVIESIRTNQLNNPDVQ